MIDGGNSVVAEECGKNLLQNFAVRQHVGDAARNPKIIFENREAPVWKPHEVCAADADVNPPRHRQASHLAPEVAATVDQFSGYDAIRQNPSPMVDVLQEHVQGGDSLGQAIFDLAPL